MVVASAAAAGKATGSREVMWEIQMRTAVVIVPSSDPCSSMTARERERQTGKHPSLLLLAASAETVAVVD